LRHTKFLQVVLPVYCIRDKRRVHDAYTKNAPDAMSLQGACANKRCCHISLRLVVAFRASTTSHPLTPSVLVQLLRQQGRGRKGVVYNSFFFSPRLPMFVQACPYYVLYHTPLPLPSPCNLQRNPDLFHLQIPEISGHLSFNIPVDARSFMN